MAKTKAPAAREGGLDPGLPQKKRARRRLVGAVAVTLALAITLPLLLDSEPRRPVEDIQVQIPSRDTPVTAPPAAKTAPSSDPQRNVAGAGAAAAHDAGSAPADGKAAGRSSDGKADAKSDHGGRADGKPAAEPRSTEAGKGEKADGKADGRSDAKSAGRTDGKADAKAGKADGKADPKARDAKGEGRYALQVGAFSTEKGANDQVEKLKQAGHPAYVERIRTGQGERIRVRVGPFGSREAADKARADLKLIGVDSAVIAP